MSIRYNDGTVDPRLTLEHGFTYHKTEYAKQVDPDLTITTVEFDVYTASVTIEKGKEREEYRVLRIAYEQTNCLDSATAYSEIKPGDIFQVVKGRKYPKGTTFTMTAKWEYFPTAYSRFGTYYIKGITEDGQEIKVALGNCRFIGVSEEPEAYDPAYYEYERICEMEPYGCSLETRDTYGY